MAEKNLGGRPSKMPNFIEALEKLLYENPFHAVIMTDEELRFLCNEMLEEKDQISDRTFKRWKNWEDDSDEYRKFCHLYKKALSQQKHELFQSMKNDDKSRQRFARIIERKFSEWNLRNISEVNQKHSVDENLKDFIDQVRAGAVD